MPVRYRSRSGRLERLRAELAAALDQYYIPTCHPNGLPGGIPADAYNRADGDRAFGLAARVIEAVGQHVRSA
jgi:HEPN domain-containing protein